MSPRAFDLRLQEQAVLPGTVKQPMDVCHIVTMLFTIVGNEQWVVNTGLPSCFTAQAIHRNEIVKCSSLITYKPHKPQTFLAILLFFSSSL